MGVGGGWGLACRVEGAWRVGGVLHVVLRQRGRSAGSWRAVLGRRAGWQGVACRVGAAWWWVGSGGLACRVGAARWVGGGGMEVARLHKKPAMSSRRSCTPCWGGEVGWRWRGVGAGWRWLACANGLQRPSRVLRAVLGRRGGLAVAAYWGRDE
ncbi:hypothetical protein EDB86DRAFT_2829609 [Lactarius hatsudake]|nr:hypothetical protein EDB86DRAFT_2829609 [Lactarius hatsudake]